MRSKFFIVACVALCLAGCVETPWRTNIGSTRALMTPADARIITERPRPSYKTPILCAEPSPDIAKALSTLAKLSGGNGAVNVGGGISTAESVSLLAGRTAGVVALRDGLFKACEAYANGVITSKSYALILGNYGDILVTLMLGEDVAGAAAYAAASNPAAAAAPSLTLDFPGGAATMTSGPTTGATTPPATASTTTTTTAPGSTSLNAADPMGPAFAASASSFANDAVASKKPAATAPPTTTPPSNAAPATTPTASTGTDDSATRDPMKGAMSGMSAPEAINNIARIFLVDSAPNRLFGSLVVACLSGETASDTGPGPEYRHYEGKTGTLAAICRDLPTELKSQYDAQAALQARIGYVQVKTAEATESAAESAAAIQKIALSMAINRAEPVAKAAPPKKVEVKKIKRKTLAKATAKIH